MSATEHDRQRKTQVAEDPSASPASVPSYTAAQLPAALYKPYPVLVVTPRDARVRAANLLANWLVFGSRSGASTIIGTSYVTLCTQGLWSARLPIKRNQVFWDRLVLALNWLDDKNQLKAAHRSIAQAIRKMACKIEGDSSYPWPRPYKEIAHEISLSDPYDFYVYAPKPGREMLLKFTASDSEPEDHYLPFKHREDQLQRQVVIQLVPADEITSQIVQEAYLRAQAGYVLFPDEFDNEEYMSDNGNDAHESSIRSTSADIRSEFEQSSSAVPQRKALSSSIEASGGHHRSMADLPPGSSATVQDGPLSENERYLLSKPSVTLYVTNSPESQEAFRLLEEAGIRFHVEPARTEASVAATWDILSFEGLQGVSDLAAIHQRVGTVARRETDQSLPDLTRDPRVEQAWDEARQRQLEEAREALKRVQTPTVAPRRARRRSA